jgi:hypothetical protein
MVQVAVADSSRRFGYREFADRLGPHWAHIASTRISAHLFDERYITSTDGVRRPFQGMCRTPGRRNDSVERNRPDHLPIQ